MTGQSRKLTTSSKCSGHSKPCTGNKKAMMAIVLNNDSDHNSCGVLCHYLKIIFIFHCPSESLWLLGIQWSIPNVAMIIMNGAHYPRLENFLFSTCQPSTPTKKLPKNQNSGSISELSLFFPLGNMFASKQCQTMPPHTCKCSC